MLQTKTERHMPQPEGVFAEEMVLNSRSNCILFWETGESELRNMKKSVAPQRTQNKSTPSQVCCFGKGDIR